jgi:tetratricopeptide (TPR) repeat protein
MQLTTTLKLGSSVRSLTLGLISLGYALSFGFAIHVQAAPLSTSTITVEVPQASMGLQQFALEQKGVELLLANEPARALEQFDELIASDPTDIFSLNNRANARMQLGDIKKAIADYDQAILIDDKKSFLFYNRAIARTQAKQVTEALADYTAALALDPQDTRSLTNRGNLYAKLANLPAALADFDAALKINPRLARAAYNRAHVRRLDGDFKGAFADYQIASKLFRAQGFDAEALNADRRVATLVEEQRTGKVQLPGFDHP